MKKPIYSILLLGFVLMPMVSFADDGYSIDRFGRIERVLHEQKKGSKKKEKDLTCYFYDNDGYLDRVTLFLAPVHIEFQFGAFDGISRLCSVRVTDFTHDDFRSETFYWINECGLLDFVTRDVRRFTKFHYDNKGRVASTSKY